jgi:hypothetical protein
MSEGGIATTGELAITPSYRERQDEEVRCDEGTVILKCSQLGDYDITQ